MEVEFIFDVDRVKEDELVVRGDVCRGERRLWIVSDKIGETLDQEGTQLVSTSDRD